MYGNAKLLELKANTPNPVQSLEEITVLDCWTIMAACYLYLFSETAKSPYHFPIVGLCDIRGCTVFASRDTGKHQNMFSMGLKQQ